MKHYHYYHSYLMPYDISRMVKASWQMSVILPLLIHYHFKNLPSININTLNLWCFSFRISKHQTWERQITSFVEGNVEKWH